LGGLWAVSGLAQAPLDAIQLLPRVQDKEREDRPHWVVNSSTKEAPEMDHHCWIWDSKINGGDVLSLQGRTQEENKPYLRIS